MYEASVVAKEEMAISYASPFPLFCPINVGGRLQFFTRKEKVGRQRKRGRKYNNDRRERGKEKKGTRKIKNASRAEAGRKPPVGLSAGKLTSNCL